MDYHLFTSHMQHLNLSWHKYIDASFWFVDIRCREKQRKEAARLQTVNRKLNAMNKLLMEENDRLQKQVSHLVYENGHMKHQLHTVTSSTFVSFKTLLSYCYIFLLNSCNLLFWNAGFWDDHRQELWVCGRKWSATSTTKL